MTNKAPAPPAAERRNTATESPDTIEFYFRKERILPVLLGVQAIQKREDLSGVFARKCGRQARVLRAALVALQKESDDLSLLHAEKFPEKLESGEPHPQAGKPTPVYQTEVKNGVEVPVFKKDREGNETEERIVVPGKYNLKDPGKYQEDFNKMMKEYALIRCSPFLTKDPTGSDTKWVPELARFKGVNGTAIDACMDLEQDADTTKKPLKFYFVEAVEDAAAAVTEAPEAVADEASATADAATAP